MSGGSDSNGGMGMGGGMDSSGVDGLGVDAFGGDNNISGLEAALGIVDLDTALEAPLDHMATKFGYVNKNSVLGIGKKGFNAIRDFRGPTYGPNATPVAVPGYDPGLGPHYDGPVNSLHEQDSPIAPFGIDTTNVNYNPFGYNPNPNFNPSTAPNAVDMIDPVNTTPVNSGATNAILDAFGIENGQPTNQQETDALMDAILGQQSMDNDVMGLDNAMVSTENNPWGYNRSVVASLGPSFDMGSVSQAGGGADLQRLITLRKAMAQEAAKKIINVSNDVGLTPEDVQDILPSTPPSGGGTPPSGGTNPPPKRPNRGGRDGSANNPPKRVETAAERLVKVITAPKISRSISRPILREAIKTGNIIGSDNQVDLIRAILNPPKTLTRAQQINQSGRGGGGK